MKKLCLTLVLALALTPALAFAAPKTYQVTGPVTAMTADTITVQKGKESWEIARGTAAVPPAVQVGSKVTIQYTMTAAAVTAKGSAPAAAPAAPAAGQ